MDIGTMRQLILRDAQSFSFTPDVLADDGPQIHIRTRLGAYWQRNRL